MVSPLRSHHLASHRLQEKNWSEFSPLRLISMWTQSSPSHRGHRIASPPFSCAPKGAKEYRAFFSTRAPPTGANGEEPPDWGGASLGPARREEKLRPKGKSGKKSALEGLSSHPGVAYDATV